MRNIFRRIPVLPKAYHFLLALCGAMLYRFPSKEIFVIGVTGTKGKTTALELMNAILESAGKKTALLSSIKVKIGEHTEKNLTNNTMPGRFFIQRFLRRAVASGCHYALIEVTSEGVASFRHRCINWNTAFFLNLHPEHIEAHGTFQKYRAAKLSFLKYAAKKHAKIFMRKDDPNTNFLASALGAAPKELYSKDDVPPSYFEGNLPMDAFSKNNSSVPGFFWSEFNKDNAAAAVALGRNLGIEEDTMKRALRNFKGIPGRMEFVAHEPFLAVVDYAHTPDSLEAAYKSIRAYRPSGRFLCVLGSAGGGRDKWKRPKMGEIAGRYCEEIILTDEDPYDENPEAIVQSVRSGISGSRANIMEIMDRRKAIEHAVASAKQGDAVIVTGKGSESWIHAARGKKIPWSDSGILKEAIVKRNRP